MVTIVKYSGTESEKTAIVNEQTAAGRTLFQVQNVTEGNFLAFVDLPALHEFIAGSGGEVTP